MNPKIKRETFEVVCWPDIQYLMDKDGFYDNAYLVNDEKGMEDYGSSAYFVNSEWLKQNTSDEGDAEQPEGKEKKWDFVYDEEYPDTNGGCFGGVISDGERFLFYSVYRDDYELVEHCSVRSNMAPIDGTELCRYPWTPENDEILLECLNGCGDNYCNDESPLHGLQFKLPEEMPDIARATIRWKDTGEIKIVLIKLDKEVTELDEAIFFYCENLEEFLKLLQENNGEDFVVIDWSPEYSEQYKA